MSLEDDEGIADGDVGGLGKKNFFPDAHVFVGRRGIPVNPGDAEIVFSRSGNFDGEGVGGAGFQIFGDIEFEGAVGAGDVFGVGDFLAVEPDVGAVVDSVEMEPVGFFRDRPRGHLNSVRYTRSRQRGCLRACPHWRKKSFRDVVHAGKCLRLVP